MGLGYSEGGGDCWGYFKLREFIFFDEDPEALRPSKKEDVLRVAFIRLEVVLDWFLSAYSSTFIIKEHSFFGRGLPIVSWFKGQIIW